MPTGNVVEIPIQAIDLDDTEFEFRVGARVKDLVEDIRRNGQQFPVVIRPTEGEKYQLISGFRRCRAIVALGWSRVRALIRTDLDEDGAYTLSYLENERRKSLTGADRAHAIVKLRLRGKSDEEIARIYGIGQRQIERYRKVSTFPEDLTRAVAEGRVPTTHGLLLMREMERRKGGFDLSEWIGRVEGETLSVRVLARRLNAAGSKRIPNVRYLERRGERAFRLYPMSYDPERTDETTRLAMLARLKEAVALLEDPAQP